MASCRVTNDRNAERTVVHDALVAHGVGVVSDLVAVIVAVCPPVGVAQPVLMDHRTACR